jgi:hypothetical protein
VQVFGVWRDYNPEDGGTIRGGGMETGFIKVASRDEPTHESCLIETPFLSARKQIIDRIQEFLS